MTVEPVRITQGCRYRTGLTRTLTLTALTRHTIIFTGTTRPVHLNMLFARFRAVAAQAARPNRPASRGVGGRTDRSTFRLSTAIIRACMGQATRVQARLGGPRLGLSSLPDDHGGQQNDDDRQGLSRPGAASEFSLVLLLERHSVAETGGEVDPCNAFGPLGTHAWSLSDKCLVAFRRSVQSVDECSDRLDQSELVGDVDVDVVDVDVHSAPLVATRRTMTARISCVEDPDSL